jgi:hypothetical protein
MHAVAICDDVQTEQAIRMEEPVSVPAIHGTWPNWTSVGAVGLMLAAFGWWCLRQDSSEGDQSFRVASSAGSVRWTSEDGSASEQMATGQAVVDGTIETLADDSHVGHVAFSIPAGGTFGLMANSLAVTQAAGEVMLGSPLEETVVGLQHFRRFTPVLDAVDGSWTTEFTIDECRYLPTKRLDEHETLLRILSRTIKIYTIEIDAGLEVESIELIPSMPLAVGRFL